MQIFSAFNYSIQEYVFIPLSQIGTKCYKVAAPIFHQLSYLLSKPSRNLIILVWKYVSRSSMTSRLINHLSQPMGLLKQVPLEVWITHILSQLNAKDLHNLFLTSKSFLGFLKAGSPLDQLFSNPTLNHLKLASLVRPQLEEINFRQLTSAHLALMLRYPNRKVFASLLEPAMQEIREINFSRLIWGRLTPEHLVFILCCPNLTNLDLSHSDLTDADLKVIAPSCPHLRNLNLSNCSKLTDKSLEVIIRSWPHLTNLNLCACSSLNLTDEVLKAIAKSCPKLRYLNLSWNNIAIADLRSIFHHYPNLTSLNLSRCRNLKEAALQANAGLKEIAHHCPNLISLDFEHYSALTDTAIKAIVSYCPNLTRLNLSECGDLTDEGLKAVGLTCPNLKNLNLFLCTKLTDKGLQVIVQSCPYLESLNLRGCYNLTEHSLKKMILYCRNLTTLDLSIFKNLTNEDLGAIAQSCSKLTSLSLDDDCLTDERLPAIAQYFPNLINLDISFCRNLTNLKEIFQSFPNISITLPD